MSAAVLVLAGSAAAQFAPFEIDEITPAGGGFSGIDVVLAGDVAVVSSPDGLSVSGDRAVDVYREVGGSWSLEQRLDPPPGLDVRFGWSLDFDGTSLIVGSTSLPSGSDDGVAVVYTFDGVEWSGAVLPNPPDDDENFGTDVAIDGNLALVGAPRGNVWPGAGPTFTEAGVAYAYRRNGAGEWQLKQRIEPSDPDFNGAFGISLDLDGDHALVGASGSNLAFAYRYAPGALWSETQILEDFLQDPDNAFGEELAIDGTRAVIGAWQDGVAASGFGAAFVYERRCGTWESMQALPKPSGSATFARAVDIDGDVVIAGALSTAVGGQNLAGAAYAYRYDGVTWQLEQTLTAATPTANEQLGRSIAIDGDRALIGAPGAGAGGSAFLFEATPVAAPFTDLGFALGGDEPPALRGVGTLAPATPLDVVIACGPASGVGALVIGLAEIAAPFKGGTLVPAPLALVTGLPLDAAGALTLSSTWPAGIPAGTDVTLQTWIPDASGPAGFTSTNGLRLTAK